jgi:hypothetical protein
MDEHNKQLADKKANKDKKDKKKTEQELFKGAKQQGSTFKRKAKGKKAQSRGKN